MWQARPTRLQWGAVVALALLVLAAAPHFHDEAEAHDGTCVLCHVQGSPPIAASVHDSPDPPDGGSLHAPAQGAARSPEIKRHGSRAPPA